MHSMQGICQVSEIRARQCEDLQASQSTRGRCCGKSKGEEAGEEATGEAVAL